MVGTRNLAFPRLNAFSYYVYLIGGLFLYTAFFLNTGPDAGWFAYVPLSGPQFSPGKRVDVWAQMITFTEISSLAVAVNLITTIFKQRAPGMSLNRIPLYVWAMLVTSFMVVFAMPAVMLSSLMLALDRLVDTHFFNPAEGGDALLWQHLFWFFGHPEVYIIFIPATGIVSTILAPFTRREVFGYMALVLSLVATGFIGFGLWVHHMFATGLPQLGASFFTAASIMIAIPSGTQIFCWIATLWGGQLRFKTPLLYVLGFLFTFVIGGLTGVMLAAVPLDLQVHDTFFVVAHFHYVLIGGAVFPLLGGLFYWFPKMTGRMLSETLGQGLLLAGLPRLPGHLLPAAHPRARGDAAPGLHLPAGDRLGSPEPALDRRRLRPRPRRAGLRAQHARQPAPRRAGRRRPLGGGHPGVGDLLAAAPLQLPVPAHGRRPLPALALARGPPGGDRPAQRPPGVPDHRPARRRAGPPPGLPRPHALALRPLARGRRHLHRRHLHPLGPADRRGAVRDRADRLVLAAGGPGARRCSRRSGSR